MPFLTLTQAKAHCRIDGTDGDADLTLKIAAAERLALEYLQCDVYADQPALDAAIAAVPAQLAAAKAAYEAALEIVEAAAKSGQYGIILFATVPLSPAVKTLKEESPYLMQKLAQISRTYNLPVIISVSAGSRFDYYRDLAKQEGLCVFTNADDAVKKLALYLQAL
jgi:hypothetical protein